MVLDFEIAYFDLESYRHPIASMAEGAVADRGHAGKIRQRPRSFTSDAPTK